MSNVIDTKVVEMKFDNRDFETNINSTMSILDKFKERLNLPGSSKGLSDISDSAKACTNNMSPLGAAAQNVGAKFSALQVMGTTALVELTRQAVHAGENIVKALTIDPVMSGYNMYEKKLSAVQVMMSSTGQDIDTVTKYLKELNTYSNKTIYSFSDMTDNVGKFTNAGVDLETAVTAIKGISNQAALAGANTNECSRAMYNLSQSLAVGHMQLIDWKSIENANMATVDFKNALIDTANELGTLEKTADHVGKTADGTEVTFQSFNNTLQKQWLTTDVLIKTLQNYADENSEVGKKAYAAAQDIKSFSQLLDVLKEEVASGWSDTFELIFGNLEEAKKLWSGVYKVVGGGLQSITDARNNLIKNATWSKWKLLSEQVQDAGIDLNVFERTLIKVGKEHGVITDTMIDQMGGFEASLKSGWLTTDIFAESINKIIDAGGGAANTTADVTEKLKQFDDVVAQVIRGDFGDGEARIKALTDAGYDASLIQALVNDQINGTSTALEQLSDEQLTSMGYTKEQIQSFRTLAKQAKATGTPLNELINTLNKPSGGTLMFEGLKNIIGSILKIVGSLKDAFNDVFSAQSMSSGLYNIIEGFHNLSEGLKLSDDGAKKFKSAFRGIFAAIDIVNVAIGKAIKILSPLGRLLKDVAGIILDIFAKIGDEIYAFDQFIKKNQELNDAIQSVHDWLDKGITKLEGFVKAASVEFNFGGFKIFDSFMKGVSKRAEEAGEGISTFGTVIHKIFDPIGAFLSKIGAKLKEFGKTFRETFVEGLSSGNFKKTVDLFNSVLGGGVLMSIIKFIKGFGDSVKDFGGIKSVLESVQGCFESYQKSLKADVLKKIATAIAILVGSIAVLSLIDSAKLSESIFALSTLFGELMIASAIYTKLTTVDKKSGKKQKNMVGQMIGLAAAVLILSIALKKVSDIGVEDMVKSVIAIGVLSGIMVVCAKKLANNDKKAMKGALGMVLFAVAIRVLASACKPLATLSWEEMAKGLIGVGVLMAEVSLFLNNTKFSLKAGIAAAGVLVLSAAMLVFSLACKSFASMDVNSLIKGLGSIAIVLGTVALFMKLSGGAKHVVSTGVALIAIAAAMKIMASACKSFGSMDVNTLAKGLLSMGAALGIVTIAVNLMPKKGMIAAGLGMIGIGAGLLIIAKAVSAMGTMRFEDLAKGLGALVGVLITIGVASKLIGGGKLALLGAGLIVLSAGLTLLTVPLMMLGSMSTESIAKALITLAASLTIIGIAAAVLAPTVPAILALSVGLIALGAAIGVVGIGIGLVGAGLQAISVGIGMLVGSVSGGIGIIDVVKNMFTGLVSIIGNLAGSFFAAAGTVGSAIIEGIGGFLENLGPNISNFFSGAVDVIGSFLSDFFSGAKEVGGKAIEGIKEGISTIDENIKTFFANGVQAIKDKWPEFKAKAKEAGSKAIEGIKEGVSNIDKNIKTFFANGVQAIKDKWPEFKAKAKGAGSKAIEGIKDGLSNFQETVSNIINKAKNAISDKISTWKDVGSNLIDGLKNGIKGAASNVVEAAKGVVSSAINAAKNLLGIHSPSRVFKEIGRYTDLGFAEGLSYYASAVKSASEEVATSAVDTVSSSIKSLNDLVNENIDPNPTIAPVMDLSNVEAGINSINGMSCNIGTIQATGRIAAGMDERMKYSQNGNSTTSQGNNVNFVQNNYSPKSLSRMDIYRQTQNQISMMKGLVNA